jgi:hypothetical protein
MRRFEASSVIHARNWVL